MYYYISPAMRETIIVNNTVEYKLHGTYVLNTHIKLMGYTVVQLFEVMHFRILVVALKFFIDLRFPAVL
jgi:hypothetical protein